MRKRYKRKRGCPLCKPHKAGHANRWNAGELQPLKMFEAEKRFFLGLREMKE